MPKHSLFERLSQPEDTKYGADYSNLYIGYMHGGVTFCEKYYNKDGKVLYVKVGCDYQHYGDERYMSISKFEDAGSIKWDAEKLYEWLENYPDVEYGYNKFYAKHFTENSRVFDN